MSESPVRPHSSSARELKQRLDAERQGISFLVLRDNEDKQQIHPLGDGGVGRLSLGRSADADICLKWDDQVSSIHAELERLGSEWTITDDGLSRNGTFLNGERVQGRRRLEDGDSLRVGETLAVFRSPSMEEGTTGATVAAGSSALAVDLSPAQRKVLVALCRPFKGAGAFATPATNKEIADELFLSVDAVKTHLRALFRKFDVEGVPQNQKRARLVELAFKAGIVSERDL